MNGKHFFFTTNIETDNLDSILISRHYKLKRVADFKRIKYENPRLKQSEIANQLGYSSSTLQRYRNDINMVSPYRIQPNNNNKRTKKASNTTFANNSYRESDVERPQMTSNDLKTTQRNTKSNKKTENILEAGSIHENIESNDQNFDELFHKNNP